MLISAEHAEILKWFFQNTGAVLPGWPKPIGKEKNIFIANRAKGIHKPAGLEYSTCLRVSYGEQYGDGPDVFSDGTWRLHYHREIRKNSSDPTKFATNIGVMKCMNDGIPVGVIQQISKTPNQYKVFGLGLVTSVEGQYFIVEGPVKDNGKRKENSVVTDQTDIEKLLMDSRNKTLTEVYRRQGQGRFRNTLLKAYDGKCAISGCQIKGLLDAAHILPHRGSASDFVQNGILLRTDLHTLFDLGLISIGSEDFTCTLDKSLKEDSAYGCFEGRKINLPKNHAEWPDKDCLSAFSDLKQK